MDPSRTIQSMFHRRLVLLMSGVVTAVLSLTAQAVRLSVVHGVANRERAEDRLNHITYLPTYRGSILDRNGVVLAHDVASYDVAVPYEVITGSWAVEQAELQAKEDLGAARWEEMGPEERGEAILARTARWDARVDALWRAMCEIGGLTEAELHARLDEIKEEVQTLATAVWERRAAIEAGKHARESGGRAGSTRLPIREQRQAHVVLGRVSDEVAFEFQRLAMDWSELIHVKDSRRREHPMLEQEVTLDRSTLPGHDRGQADPVTIRVIGVADHILGAMRDQVWASDIGRRKFGEDDLGGYRVGDSVGARGLELVFEDHLRGLRGRVLKRLDTGIEERIDHQPGKDLHLALDVALQARVQAILMPEFGLTQVQPWHENEGLPLSTPLNSAAVVLDVETGRILAMVSMPTIAMAEQQDASAELDIMDAWVNRPIEAIYPPGSIIKPLVLAAAVSEGVHGLDDRIQCTGHYFPNRIDAARCWIYREHYHMTTHTAQIGGPLDAVAALARSCNIYFYTLADRLGAAKLTEWYRRFGLGAPLDVGLLYRQVEGDGSSRWVGESGGVLPDPNSREAASRFNTVIMGIGQGPIAWTPVQAANAYATLARGGVHCDATLLLDDPRERAHRQEHADLQLRHDLVRTALEGLRQSVEESHGTGHNIRMLGEPIINAQGVKVWAKTGTAQAPPKKLRVDEQSKFVVNREDLDHAWFVGLVGDDVGQSSKPQYAVVVIVEYGGSGGRVAGPVANQIILALQHHGYLPGALSNSSDIRLDAETRSRGGERTRPTGGPSNGLDHLARSARLRVSALRSDVSDRAGHEGAQP